MKRHIVNIYRLIISLWRFNYLTISTYYFAVSTYYDLFSNYSDLISRNSDLIISQHGELMYHYRKLNVFINLLFQRIDCAHLINSSRWIWLSMAK